MNNDIAPGCTDELDGWAGLLKGRDTKMLAGLATIGGELQRRSC